MSFTDPGAATDPNLTAPSFAPDQGTPDPSPEQHDKAFLIAGDRAFRDRDSLVKHISSAQEHIKTLEAERAEDRQKVAELTAEVDRLRKIADAAAATTGKPDQVVDPEDVAKRAVTYLTQQEQAKARAANLAAAVERAKTAYGDGYATKITEVASKLGMTLEEVDTMASNRPALFDATFLPASTKTTSAYQPDHGRSSVHPQDGKPEDQRRNVMKMSEKERMAYISNLIHQQ